MNRFEYVKPANLDDAASVLKKGGTPKAGGVDLLDRMKEGISTPARVVSLACGRKGDSPPVTVDDQGARISAFATLAEVAAHADLRRRYPALARAAADAATPQIRNLATVGGNLLQEPRCWYYRLVDFTCLRKGGDSCPALAGENQYHAILGYGRCPVVHPSNLAPALVALAAGVAVAGATPRRKVEELWPPPTDLARFHTLASGEVLTEVILPPVGENAYVEIRQKQSFDWALASAAVARNAKEGWRVVLGAVAPRPWRAAAAEEFLGSADLTAERIEKAAELAVRGGKPLTKNAYKVKLARVAVKRALTEAAGGAK